MCHKFIAPTGLRQHSRGIIEDMVFFQRVMRKKNCVCRRETIELSFQYILRQCYRMKYLKVQLQSISS